MGLLNNNIIHWCDLDHTLWTTNAQWWIIDKNNPHTYLLRVSTYEGNLITNGFYIADEHCFHYNGITGYLPHHIWEQIQTINPTLTIDNIGLSFREFNDDDLIKTQAESLIIHIDRIKKIEPNSVINLVTARGNHDGHVDLLGILNKTLIEHNLKLNKIWFVNDAKYCKLTGGTELKKCLLILESLIGYKVTNTCFEPILADKYKIAYFYDDEDKNIIQCQKMNEVLNVLLNNTQPWLKQKIEDNIVLNTPELKLHLVNSNELNPYTITDINLKTT